jgi:hypothetical protein
VDENTKTNISVTINQILIKLIKWGRKNFFAHRVKTWFEIMVNLYHPETGVFNLPVQQRL